MRVSGRGCWGLCKERLFFKGLATGSLTMFQWVYRQHKLDFFSYWGEDYKGGSLEGLVSAWGA